MKFWIKGAVAIIPALVLVGCGTSGDVQEDTGTSAGQSTTSSTAGSGGSSPAFTSGVGGGATSGESMQDSGTMQGDSGAQDSMFQSADPLDDPNSLLATRVIYFDFDKSDVRSDFMNVVQAHAEYLAANPNMSITLEGHCDERGTREYNIALGERRAQAVQRLLTLQGVSPTQIRTISYGEERPAALGSTEDAYALNRRVEIIYNR